MIQRIISTILIFAFTVTSIPCTEPASPCLENRDCPQRGLSLFSQLAPQSRISSQGFQAKFIKKAIAGKKSFILTVGLIAALGIFGAKGLLDLLTQPSPGDSKARREVTFKLDEKILKLLSEGWNVPPEICVGANHKPPQMISDLSGYELVSDAGNIMDVVLFQLGDSIALSAISDMIEALRKDVKVAIVANNQVIASAVWRHLKSRGIPELHDRLQFIFVPQSFSSWGRDPFVVLVDPKTRKYTLFPAKGDAGTGLDSSLGRQLMSQGIGWDFFSRNDIQDPTLDMQGGDITSDDTYAYVGSSTIHYSCYNIASACILTEEEAIARIEAITGKKVIVLDGLDCHNDRYHLPVGQTKYGKHTSLLADPVWALEIIASLTPQEKEDAIKNILKVLRSTPATKDISYEDVRAFLEITPQEIALAKQSEEVRKLEMVRSDLEARGIRVVRVPSLPKGFAGNPFGIYYTNALLDGDGAIIPRYLIPKLDRTARGIYEDSGFRDIREVTAIILGVGEGGLRCLVQVMGFPRVLSPKGEPPKEAPAQEKETGFAPQLDVDKAKTLALQQQTSRRSP